MLSTRSPRTTAFALLAFAVLVFSPLPSHAQAALLMEEPYGFFGTLNPTGHNAVYFQRICAETPVKLRRCQAGEQGSVLARYQGISGYDWVAIPLIPYLYSVENSSEVPAHVNRETVKRLRNRYHEAHLLSLGKDLHPGNFVHGGWTQLVGVSYERRIYAFRFETTEEQDDAFIALMNAGDNRSHFEFFYNNCSDFSRRVLNFFLPNAFHRSIFPDAGMTTPTQTAYNLDRYVRKHPGTQLTILVIPQIPGYRHHSRANHGVAESFLTTGVAIPLALVNPYLAGGIVVDYIVRGRHNVIPRHPPMLSPDNLFALTAPGRTAENLVSAGAQVPSAAVGGSAETKSTATANSGLQEIKVAYEQILAAESQKPRKD
jgi:hypothetical protein